MSANTSVNTADRASGPAVHSASSPFSPHAAAFGPSVPSDASVHSLSSRTSPFSSPAQNHTSSNAPHNHMSLPTTTSAHSSNPTLSTSPFPNPDAAPSSAGLYTFTDRVRNSSDHSRQSSIGAMSNLSAGSAAAAPPSRRTQSPLAPTATESIAHPQMSILGARSPTSLAPPTASDQQQRRLSSSSSSSFAAHNTSHNLLLPDAANGGTRPPFGRQSFSDGPSISAAHFLSADPASSSIDARSGSFSGTFPNADSISPLPQHNPSPLDAGLSDPQLASAAPTPPTTGPLSASDPRTQLLVSNLPYRVRWQDLKDLFRKAGTVLRADVSLSADNRSRGYGTVLMATEQDAVKAADMLGGFTWQGRTLDVRVDRSGTLVGVAGSAVLPTIASNGPGSGATASPHAFANGGASSNSNAFPFDPTATAGAQHFLGVPSASLNGPSQGHSPASLSAAASPSALSPLARAADYPYSSSSRASFSALSDAGLTASNSNQASELERAMLHGALGLSSGPGSANGTSNRQRPRSNFDIGFGGPAQHRAVSAVQSLAPSSLSSRRGSDVGSGSGSGSPAPAAWTSSINDTIYSQNAGGSSVPTGFPGAPAMAPWPAGPGAFGGPITSSMQSQPFGSQMPTTSYAGRVLFVGNLPFHCQWQDLKDLFRAAGNIQRADVAIGPDGRSRGFGTVLFGTQEDAQNAVRLYHGYEYSGRTLKVHFDRFAAQNGPAVGTPGNPAQYTGAFAAAALPSHMTNNVRAAPVPAHLQKPSTQGAFGQQAYPLQSMQQQQQQQQQQQLQQQRNNMPMSFGMAQQQGQAALGQTAIQPQYPGSQHFSSLYQPSLQVQHQQQRYDQHSQQPTHMASGFSAFADLGRQQSASGFGGLDDARQHGEVGAGPERRASTATPFGLFSKSEDAQDKAASPSTQEDEYEGMSITLPANGFGAASSYLPSDLMSPGLVTPAAPTHAVQDSSSHPGRIQLPSANFANSFGAALAGAAPAAQMSPVAARMQVPMTPGMPGFTFHQVPQTPPLYPQMLSPGLDSFSPTVGGSAHMGGPEAAAAAAQNGGDYMNAGASVPYNVPVALTPGAPIGYHPMFAAAAPGYGGAPGLHQQQPATPHWSQTSGPRRGGGRGPLRQSMEAHNAEADEVVDGDRAAIAKTPGAGPRRPSHAEDGAGKPVARRASDAAADAVESSPTDGYPFPLVAAGSMSHLTRRASTNSPAQTPLAGPAGSTNSAKPDSVAVHAPVGELGGTSTEELANTIARLSVKGTALARESSSRRSLSMTAERTAAASAMAKLREKAATPNPPVEDVGVLGAPFGERGAAGKSRLAESNVFGLKLSSTALEAARNGSAVDSDDGGSSRRSTPAE